MKRDEVLKSLESCGNADIGCIGCMFTDSMGSLCTRTLINAAADVIREQQKEIEQLTDKHWSECRQIMHYDNELNGNH